MAGMTRTRVYLDWNATAPLKREAAAAMTAAASITGNPSSVHTEGRAARKLVEEAREAVAQAVGADARNAIFTSGGTEANALVLTPALRRGHGAAVTRLIVSAIEHASVLAGGRFAPDQITAVTVTADGLTNLEHLQRLLEDGPPAALVSVMLANNETGAIQPIRDIAAIVHDTGGLLHVDAVQGLGRLPVSIEALDADILTLSAHKIGGPKGVGALVLREGIIVPPLIQGGGQEQSRRAGTENVTGIAGFGAAVAAAQAAHRVEAVQMEGLREVLEAGLKRHDGTVIFAERVQRLPNTTLFSVPGMKAETAVIAFDLEGIAVSSGSACSSGKVGKSHVLAAMGVPGQLADGAIRLSMGADTTPADIDRCLEAWRKLAGVLRR
jgi:cysteine desulfurase